MAIDWVRKHCLSLPHVTETLQWESDLVFKVGGKMFAVVNTEPSRVWMSLKVSPENFAELCERPDIIPAPYLARAGWVALETEDALRPAEVKMLLKESYSLVLEKLPKKTRAALG